VSGATNHSAPRGARAQKQADKARERPAATSTEKFQAHVGCKQNTTLKSRNKKVNRTNENILSG